MEPLKPLRPPGIYSSNRARVNALKVGDRLRVRRGEDEATFLVSERSFLGFLPVKVLVEVTLTPTDEWFFLWQLYSKDIEWRYLPEKTDEPEPSWPTVIAVIKEQISQSMDLPGSMIALPPCPGSWRTDDLPGTRPWLTDVVQQLQDGRLTEAQAQAQPFEPLKQIIYGIPDQDLQAALLNELKVLEQAWTLMLDTLKDNTDG